MHYCRSRRGIWPGFKGKYGASLGSLIPRFKTPLFWVISLTPPHNPHRARRVSEDGQKTPASDGDAVLPSPLNSTLLPAITISQLRSLSGISSPSVA